MKKAKYHLNQLQEIPATEHKRWALCFKDSAQFTTALLAVLSNNREPILLPNNQPGTLKALADEYDAILTDEQCHTQGQRHSSEGGNPEIILSSRFSENDITFFTSGSTGEPKKVSRTLKQLICEIEALEQLFGTRMANSVIYSTVSHQHIYGFLFYILWPLYAGRKTHQPVLSYPEQIIEAINNATSAVTIISSPALLKRIDNLTVTPLKKGIQGNNGILAFAGMTHQGEKRNTTIFSSGGLLEKADADQVYNCVGSYPIEVFGSTETSGVAYRQQDQLTNNSWQPLPGVQLSLAADNHCLVVRSAFIDDQNCITMGDIAQIHNDGSFDLLGRADRIVKIEEKRASLPAIEHLLAQDELVSAAYTLKLDGKRQSIGAIIELTPKGQNLLEKMGKLWLNNRLKIVLCEHIERLLLPRQFRYVEKIPTNSQGKYVLTELKQLFD